MVIVANTRASRVSCIADQVFWIFDAERLYQFRDFLSEACQRAESFLKDRTDKDPIFSHFRDFRNDWIEGDTDIELIMGLPGSYPSDDHALKRSGGVQERIDIRDDMHFHWIDAVWGLPDMERAMESCGSRSIQADLVADWLECEKRFRDAFEPAFEAISSPVYFEHSKPREEYNVLVIECAQRSATVVTDRGKGTIRVCVDIDPMDAVQIFGGDVLKAALFITEQALHCIEKATGVALAVPWNDLESVKARASLVDEYLDYKRKREECDRYAGTVLGAVVDDDGILHSVDYFGLFLDTEELALLFGMVDGLIQCYETEQAALESSGPIASRSRFLSSVDLLDCAFDFIVKDEGEMH